MATVRIPWQVNCARSILRGTGYSVCAPATKVSLAIPTLTKKGILMANYELANDEVATIPILTKDSAGDVVPPPAGDTFTATSSSASLGAAVNGASLVLTPMVKASPNITVSVADKSGLIMATLIVDIVPDMTPTNIVLDTADATLASQPVPTAPGP